MRGAYIVPKALGGVRDEKNRVWPRTKYSSMYRRILIPPVATTSLHIRCCSSCVQQILFVWACIPRRIDNNVINFDQKVFARNDDVLVLQPDITSTCVETIKNIITRDVLRSSHEYEQKVCTEISKRINIVSIVIVIPGQVDLLHYVLRPHKKIIY